MRRLVLSALVGVAWLWSGCASDIERARLADLDDVSAATAARLAIEPVPVRSDPDDGAPDSIVATLAADGLDEREVVAIALVNNRRVRIRGEHVGISRAELVQAGLPRNPTLSGNAIVSGRGTNIELELVQSLVELFFLPSRRRVAEAHLEAEKASATRELVGIAFEARRAYVDVRDREHRLRLARRSHDAAQAALELSQILRAAGNVTPLQHTLMDLEESRARLDLAAAEAAVTSVREPLNVALGLWGPATAWKLASAAPLDLAATGYDLERVETRAVTSSLDLAENAALARAAAEAAGLAVGEGLFPRLVAGGAAESPEEGGWGFGPDLAIELPVFDTGAARTASARGRMRELLARHVELAVHVRSAARGLRASLVALDERARYLREVHLPLATRRTRQTLQLYNAMQVGASAVIAARRDELDVEREATETLREAWHARLNLEELLAGRLETDTGHDEGPPEPARTRAGSGGH